MGRLAYVSINKPKHKQAPLWMFLLHYHSKGIYQQKVLCRCFPCNRKHHSMPEYRKI